MVKSGNFIIIVSEKLVKEEIERKIPKRKNIEIGIFSENPQILRPKACTAHEKCEICRKFPKAREKSINILVDKCVLVG